MKLSFRLVIVFILTVALVCACGEPEEIFDLDYNSETSADTDLEGRKIVYEMQYSDETLLGFELDTEFADLAKKRVGEVEKNYNCELELAYNSGDFGKLISMMYAGTFFCDIMCGNTNNAFEAIRIGALTGYSSLNGIIDINNSEKWGNSRQLLGMCWEDDVYGVIPAAWPELTLTSWGYPLVVNEEKVEELSLPDPREYIENKAWTWAQFRECIEDYTVIEGGIVKTYGFSTTESSFTEMFVRTNGNHIIARDSNGNHVFGFSDESAIAAMSEARDILYGDLSYAVYVGLPEPSVNKLVDGEATMCSSPTSYVYGSGGWVSKNVSNFAVLSWPCGPNVDSDYAFSLFSGYGYCITLPVNGHYPDISALVLDALYEPLPGFETPDAIKEYMSRYFFFDRRDTEYYYRMYLNQDNLFNNCNIGSAYKDFITSKEAISSFIESKSSAANKTFDEYILPAVRGAEAVWGPFDY